MTGGQVAEGFFKVYLALPVMILFYIIGYAWKRTLPQRAHEIDLDVRSCFASSRGHQPDFPSSSDWPQELAHSGGDETIPRRAQGCSSPCPHLPHAVHKLSHRFSSRTYRASLYLYTFNVPPTSLFAFSIGFFYACHDILNNRYHFFFDTHSWSWCSLRGHGCFHGPYRRVRHRTMLSRVALASNSTMHQLHRQNNAWSSVWGEFVMISIRFFTLQAAYH